MAAYFLVAVATTTTATAAATASVLGLVHLDIPSGKVIAVEGANRILCGAALRHLHKCEAARASGFAVRDHGYGIYGAVSTEEFSEVVLSAIEGKVANVKFTSQWVVLFAPGRFLTRSHDRARSSRDIRA